jgi:hypothetical protein
MLMEWDWLNDQLRHTLNGLYYTPMGMFIRGVPGARAAIEFLHVLGTSMLLSAICVVDLRLVGFPRSARSGAANDLTPVGVTGFLMTLVTGVVLVCGTPDRYLFDPTARWQVGFVLGAGVNLMLLHTTMFRASQNTHGHRPPLSVRLLAGIALAVCLGAIAAGRLAASGGP